MYQIMQEFIYLHKKLLPTRKHRIKFRDSIIVPTFIRKNKRYMDMLNKKIYKTMVTPPPYLLNYSYDDYHTVLTVHLLTYILPT